jgi:D-3-phosphoglycerate dehydrogenase
MMSSVFSVVVTQRNFDAASECYLRENGCSLRAVQLPEGQSDSELDEDTLAAALVDADAWIVGHARVTRSLLERLPRLQVICRRGVGYERVDVQAVKALAKVATIAVGGNDAAVADHTIGLMLAVARRHRECQIRLAKGDWSIPIGSDLYRKTVGVIGLGRIGRGVVARLAGFECRILVSSQGLDAQSAAGQGFEVATLDEVIEQSDYITLHAPLTPQTRFMIDAAALARMKKTAVLINTARGGLVDDKALLAALQERRIGGAGLDVFVSESDPEYAVTTEALLKLPTFVATSHSGGSTAESLERTNLVAAHCAVAVLRGISLDPACVIADGRVGTTGALADQAG